MKRRKKVMICSICGTALIALFFYITSDFWSAIGEHYLLNSLVIEAYDYGPLLPPVDKVDVILLRGVQEAKLKTGFYETRISDYDIAGQKTLTGKPAEDVAVIWRLLPQNPHYVALCHDPLYALRFWNNGKILCETTICWNCSNFGLTVPGDWLPGDKEFGFDSKSRAALALLDKLKQIIPPPTAAK